MMALQTIVLYEIKQIHSDEGCMQLSVTLMEVRDQPLDFLIQT